MIAANSAHMAQAAVKIAEVRERLERIRKGEDVPVSKPLTRDDVKRILREAGLTDKDIRHVERFNRVCDAFGFEEVLKIILAKRERAERAAVRALYRQIGD
jgi:hypothetical protein